MNIIIMVELIVYCLGVLALGFYFNKKGMEQEEFLMGGGKLPGWALALSERATGESVWLLVAAPGFVYASGFSSIWVVIGSWIAITVTWVFLSKPFMMETQKYGCITVNDYLARKFGDKAKLIRWFGGIMFSTLFLFYIGAQFSGAGKTLFSVFGLNQTLGMVLVAAIVITYSALGGFWSVVWTDMVQSILMICALVVLPILAYFKIRAEGIPIAETLNAVNSGYTSWVGGLTGTAMAVLIISNISWVFTLLGGQPQLSVRLMALRNEKEQKNARNIGLIWSYVAYSGVFLIGILACVLYGHTKFADQEMLIPFMITDLMPPWLGGLLLAGILSAIMSTSDSVLLVITSAISEDIIHGAIGVKLSEDKLLLVSRVTAVAAGLLGLFLGMTSKSLIYSVINWYAAGIGSTFSVAILASFFWKKTSSKGIAATLISGFIITVIWMSTPLDAIISSRFITFVVAGIVCVIVSILCPDKVKAEAEVTESE